MMMMMMMLIPEAETISTPKKWAFSGGGFSFFSRGWEGTSIEVNRASGTKCRKLP